MHDTLLIQLGRRSALPALLLALVALVGFVVVVGSQTMSEAASSDAIFIPTVAALTSSVLLAFVLVGAYAWQGDRFGTFGRAAFAVALAGTVLAAGAQWTYVFVVPHFAEAAPELVNEGTGILLVGFITSYAVLAIGWVMFSLATLRAGLVPRWLGVLLVAGSAIAFLPMPSRTLVLLIGVTLLARRMGNPGMELGLDARSSATHGSPLAAGAARRTVE